MWPSCGLQLARPAVDDAFYTAVYQALVVVAIIFVSVDGVIMTTCACFTGVKVMGRLLPPQSGKKCLSPEYGGSSFFQISGSNLQKCAPSTLLYIPLSILEELILNHS
jgi:hypothetical protein